MQGKIFVIEGTDGSGKQTQTEKLYEAIRQDYNVVKQSFPNYVSKSSELVKMYLNGEFESKIGNLDAFQASVLYAVDRMVTYEFELKEKLIEGSIIIFDRYTTSNAYHQACKIKNPAKRDEFLEWLYDFEFNMLKLPKPDKVIFLDMPYEKSRELREGRELKAGTKKDIHEQNEEYMKEAYKVGVETANKLGWKRISCVNNDGKIKSIDEIHKEVWREIKKEL